MFLTGETAEVVDFERFVVRHVYLTVVGSADLRKADTGDETWSHIPA